MIFAAAAILVTRYRLAKLHLGGAPAVALTARVGTAIGAAGRRLLTTAVRPGQLPSYD